MVQKKINSVLFTILFLVLPLVLSTTIVTGCRPTAEKPVPSYHKTTVDVLSPPSNPLVYINTKQKTLTVFKNLHAVAQFPYVALGTGGAGFKKRRGDEITPRGMFKVKSIQPSARFHLFVLIDYPTMDYATAAYESGVINSQTLTRIRTAHDENRLPPQDTALGGHLGIHGVGAGNVKIHREFNWTRGCIALENEEIEQLTNLISRDTVVIIN